MFATYTDYDTLLSQLRFQSYFKPDYRAQSLTAKENRGHVYCRIFRVDSEPIIANGTNISFYRVV